MENSIGKSDPQGLDQGYKYLVEIILNLNHDRYKSYFNHFIVVHLGIVTAIYATCSKKMADLSLFLSIIGIALGVIWLVVLYKIYRDIKQAWSLIREYENSQEYKYKIKLSDTGWKGFRLFRHIWPFMPFRWLREFESFKASFYMLSIPLVFILFYVVALRC